MLVLMTRMYRVMYILVSCLHTVPVMQYTVYMLDKIQLVSTMYTVQVSLQGTAPAPGWTAPATMTKKSLQGLLTLSSGPFASCPLEREPPSPLAFRRYILLTPEGAQCLATWKQSTDFPARLELTPVSCYPMTAVADSYPHLISLYLPLFLWPFGVGEINLLSGPSPLHDSTYFYQI